MQVKLYYMQSHYLVENIYMYYLQTYAIMGVINWQLTDDEYIQV